MLAAHHDHIFHLAGVLQVSVTLKLRSYLLPSLLPLQRGGDLGSSFDELPIERQGLLGQQKIFEPFTHLKYIKQRRHFDFRETETGSRGDFLG